MSSPMTDDWAATSKAPTTSKQGRLLPLLMQKDTPDTKQVQAEAGAGLNERRSLR